MSVSPPLSRTRTRTGLVPVPVPVLVLVLVLVQSCSSSSDPVSELHPHLQTPPQDASSSHCPSCALARMRRSDGGEQQHQEEQQEQEEAAQQDVVEAVKRHILNMLHLQARPNITRPVPRAALLNALRKLHVGRVAEDGSVQIEGGEERRRETAATHKRRQRL